MLHYADSVCTGEIWEVISKSDFINLLRKNAPSIDENDAVFADYEEAAHTASIVLNKMPGIGFMSTHGRINAFIAVCRHLNDMVSNKSISEDVAQLSIIILSLSNKQFLKARTMFDIRGPRLGVREVAALPNVARQYLNGIRMFGT